MNQTAGADAWVNGPYMSDTHQLWAEIEAMAPQPRPKKKPESTPRQKPLKKALDARDTAGSAKAASPSEASSSAASKQPTGQPPKHSDALAPAPADVPSVGKQPAPSARKGSGGSAGAARPGSPDKRGSKKAGKAKTHRPRPSSPVSRRQPSGMPQDGMGRMVQPAWDTTGPPRRAPGEVVNKWNHQGLMHTEAAAGWKAEGGAGAADPSTARSDRSDARSARSTATMQSEYAWKQNRMTTSPNTRGHPNQDRRAELRKADMHMNINYFATLRADVAAAGTTVATVASSGDPVFTAPDNDRKMKEASWISSQAWFESLRYYPQGAEARQNDDCEATYSGNTHGTKVPSEHIENDVRNRVGIAAADADWMPSQLPEPWAPEMEMRLRSLKINRSTTPPRDITDAS